MKWLGLGSDFNSEATGKSAYRREQLDGAVEWSRTTDLLITNQLLFSSHHPTLTMVARTVRPRTRFSAT